MASSRFLKPLSSLCPALNIVSLLHASKNYPNRRVVCSRLLLKVWRRVSWTTAQDRTEDRLRSNVHHCKFPQPFPQGLLIDCFSSWAPTCCHVARLSCSLTCLFSLSLILVCCSTCEHQIHATFALWITNAPRPWNSS